MTYVCFSKFYRHLCSIRKKSFFVPSDYHPPYHGAPFAFCYLFMQIRYYFASFDILFQLFLDRFSDPVLHLCCRRFCKCHNQKSVHIDRTLLICDLWIYVLRERLSFPILPPQIQEYYDFADLWPFAAVLSISRPFLSFPAFPALLVFRSVPADIFFQSLPHLFTASSEEYLSSLR